ncbi:MAG: pyrroloquinoline quinone biosynthesis peptide chaperone PqqD [Deltaproteobacteria bacterium]|nr:pyrroloquinoline quinone biosynthesis peptide chaperone PqqD [Deltaproteobacteria bacterium]
MKPKLAAKVRLKHDRHDDQWLLLYPERGQVLNATAAAIAQRLDGTRTVAAIAEELAREHGAPVAEVEADVAALVEQLAAKGLLA